jgi:ribosome-associated translation inhibitor RaiA
MLIDVRTRGVEMTPAARDYATDRTLAAVAHAADHVHSAVVFISDENGPKGGTDKTCRVAVRLYGRRVVLVEHRGSRLSLAVDGAAERLGQAIDRHLERQSRGRRRARLVRAVTALRALFGRKGVRA